ncbi:class I fructose-bisphosphate aldolase [Pedobacter mendelii]|uniref:class I fructose-bisphosphate aldolase n=1 Tax=Pedobacter mendelii TaxID=1908240 RepID=UPI00362A127C
MSKEIPIRNYILSSANALARYAAICRRCNLVPIVEPEVLMLGDHFSKKNITR